MPSASLARRLLAAGQIVRCEEICRERLAEDPGDVATLELLCRSLAAQGRVHEALSLSGDLLRLTGSRHDLHSRALHWAPCDDRLSGDDLIALGRQFSVHDPTIQAPEAFENSVDPARPLRVGYVCVEAFDHSKAFVTLPVFAAFDRSAVRTIVYADVAAPDAVTERFRHAADEWRDIRGVPDAAVRRQIREDRIDILVDLMGHVPRTRIRCLLQKPAPVLVEYLEAPSGLPAVDYRVSDDVADPEESVPGERATIVRIPGGFHAFEPAGDPPEIRPAPHPYASRPVFCAFAPAEKLSPPLLDTWATLLHDVPDAWLLLKNRSFRDARFASSIRKRFEARGIDGSRIRCFPTMPRRDWHLLTYNLADVALDTFPYNGVITTCEALWMGTPVITLAGSHHMARRGASLLSSAGLGHMIAGSREEYVALAAALVRDRDTLGAMRRDLRAQVASSALSQPRRVAAALEQQFRRMWQRWCAQSSPGA